MFYDFQHEMPDCCHESGVLNSHVWEEEKIMYCKQSYYHGIVWVLNKPVFPLILIPTMVFYYYLYFFYDFWKEDS